MAEGGPPKRVLGSQHAGTVTGQPLAAGDADLGHFGSGAHSRHMLHRQSGIVPYDGVNMQLVPPPFSTDQVHSWKSGHHAIEVDTSDEQVPPSSTSALTRRESGAHGTAATSAIATAAAAIAAAVNIIGPRAGQRVLLQRLGIMTLCLSWTVISSLAILTNKYLMVDLGFRYPITVAWMGLLSTTVLSWAARAMLLPRHVRQLITYQYYLRHFVPTGFFMALTFITGNTGYLYLTVAFVQMLKAFCPVITMVLLFAAGLERASAPLVSAVGMIAAGVAVASYGEMNLNWMGLAAMSTSIIAESVRLVMTQQLLVAGGTGASAHSIHPIEGLMHISSACTLWLALAAAWAEWLGLITGGTALATVATHPLAFITAAAAGFGVNVLAIAVIKLSSSLTLKVLGTCKDAALVTIGVVFLHEQVSTLQLWGYSVSLVGFLCYNAIQAAKHSTNGSPLGALAGAAGGSSGPGLLIGSSKTR